VRALVIEAFGQAPAVHEVPDPVCPPDGVLVRVEASGLCRSDWHALVGHDPDVRLPHVPGHEFAGVVHEVGRDVRGARVGDRVTAPFVNACGECAECRAGRQQVCARQTQPGFTRWGSFAELVAVDRAEVNLVGVPEGVSADAAAALGCRFATAFRAVVEVGRVSAGEWVAVHGCGGVGLSAVHIAHAAGARVVAVDVTPAALQLARALGAEAVVDASATGAGPDGGAGPGGTAEPSGNRGPGSPSEVAAAVQEAAGGPVQVSLDALGSPGTCAASIACLAPRGRHVQVGLLPEALGWPAVPMHLVVAGELQVLGSHGMAARSYPAMLGMVRAGRLRPGDLVARRIPLEEAGAALAAMGTARGAGVTIARP
jgi:alcohol dehydrogenase